MNNIYKLNQFDNYILLEKININFNDYKIKKLDNGDIKLLPIIKLTKINWQQIRNYDLSYSKIYKCEIIKEQNKITQLNKYSNILLNIYKLINDPISIIKNTKINIKLNKIEGKGFYYIQDLSFSFQHADANKTLLEILTQCYCNNITLNMKIKLKNGNILYINY